MKTKISKKFIITISIVFVVLLVFILSVPHLIEVFKNSREKINWAHLVDYKVALTEDEYNFLYDYYVNTKPEFKYDSKWEYAEKELEELDAEHYNMVGRLDFEDTYKLDNQELPLKKSITSILNHHENENWVEAGHDDGYELSITMNDDGMNAVITDNVNSITAYEFNINSEELNDAERYNYLVYEIPESDERIYFYCRREDFITVRIISGNYPKNYKEKYYNFMPEGTELEKNPDISLWTEKAACGNRIFGYSANIQLTEKNGAVHAVINRSNSSELHRYTINLSGVIKDGILDYYDYEQLHFARYNIENQYVQQPDTVRHLCGKIYFYRTFLLFEDANTGNEYIFAY